MVQGKIKTYNTEQMEPMEFRPIVIMLTCESLFWDGGGREGEAVAARSTRAKLSSITES